MLTNQNAGTTIAVEKRPGRNPNLDLIRCVAILFVVSAHFF